MTQEIQVTLTLEVDLTLQKADIKILLEKRLEKWLISIDNLKEESEIYENN